MVLSFKVFLRGSNHDRFKKYKTIVPYKTVSVNTFPNAPAGHKRQAPREGTRAKRVPGTWGRTFSYIGAPAEVIAEVSNDYFNFMA
jgi:hypothetical protein